MRLGQHNAIPAKHVVVMLATGDPYPEKELGLHQFPKPAAEQIELFTCSNASEMAGKAIIAPPQWEGHSGDDAADLRAGGYSAAKWVRKSRVLSQSTEALWLPPESRERYSECYRCSSSSNEWN